MTIPVSQSEALLRMVLAQTAEQQDMPITIRQVNQLAAAAVKALTPMLDTAPPRTAHGRQLTPGATATLIGMANGLGYEQMARLAGVSVDAIRSRAQVLYQRLGVSTQAQAVAAALVSGALHPGAVGPLATAAHSRLV